MTPSTWKSGMPGANSLYSRSSERWEPLNILTSCTLSNQLEWNSYGDPQLPKPWSRSSSSRWWIHSHGMQGERMAMCVPLTGPKTVGECQAGKPIHDLLCDSKSYDAWSYHPLDHQTHLLRCPSDCQLANIIKVCHGLQAIWGHGLPHTGGNVLLHR